MYSGCISGRLFPTASRIPFPRNAERTRQKIIMPYLRGDVVVNQSSASAWCSAHGGALLSLPTIARRDAVLALLAERRIAPRVRYWLDAHRDSHDGVWRWADGTELALDDQHWQAGRPNGKSAESCLSMVLDDPSLECTWFRCPYLYFEDRPCNVWTHNERVLCEAVTWPPLAPPAVPAPPAPPLPPARPPLPPRCTTR